MRIPDSQYGPITQLFTPGQIECLVRTAGEAVHGNAISDDSLSRRQIILTKLAYEALMAEYEPPGEPADISLDALGTDAMRLAAQIDDLTRTPDSAVPGAGSDPGNDIGQAGRSLIRIAGTLATLIARQDPVHAAQLRQLAAELAETAGYDAGPGEQQAGSGTGISGWLSPGIALVLQVIQAQQDQPSEPAAARVTSGELIERLRQFPPHHEVWAEAPATPDGFRPLTGQAYPGEDPDPPHGEPRHFIVLSIHA